MISINCRCASEAWLSAARMQTQSPELARYASGRGGAYIDFPRVVFEIADPLQRWSLARTPAMNPAFAIAEVVWILCGRNDVSFLSYWAPGLHRFIGSDATAHGAYGYRLRSLGGVDQLLRGFQALQADPTSRQVVLQIWSSVLDLPSNDGRPSADDIPCNLVSMLKVRNGRLDWSQIIRSNDLFLGVPHNFVQFMTLQEVVAGWLNLGVGVYLQFSDSLHIYERDLKHFANLQQVAFSENTDSLALPYEESSRVWRRLELMILQMVEGQFERETVEDAITDPRLPEGFKNFARVLVAEYCRKRGWEVFSADVGKTISNPCLSVLWEKWRARKSRQ